MIYVLTSKTKVCLTETLRYNERKIFSFLAGPEYKQVTIWPTADLDKLKTELKSDGYLHITVPIKV